MHDFETRLRAKSLYQLGWKIVDIAREVEISERTVRLWRDAGKWDVLSTPEQALDARIVHLINRDGKTDADYAELERLTDVHTRMLRGKPKAKGEAGAQPAGGERAPDAEDEPRSRKKKPHPNEIGHLDWEDFENAWGLFIYQREWADSLTRNNLTRKARQTGFTRKTIPFAATRRAWLLRNDQIFLSASKRQAQIFNNAIREAFLEVFGIKLKGSKERIVLYKDDKPWCAFIFLSTNTATAQGESGDVWIDEAAWIPRFEEMWKVASAMATLKRYIRTAVSTVSTVNNYFWKLWLGRLDKDGRQVDDGFNRVTITIHDAVAGGNGLVDVEQLKLEWGHDAFRQLFECVPLDDEQSLFKLAALERCQSDPEGWENPEGLTLLVGYDPSRRRDYAELAALARVGNKRRLIHREGWLNKSYKWQGQRIVDYCRLNHVERIAIDTTGMGDAVYEEVRGLAPEIRVVRIDYTFEAKMDLVINAKRAVDDGVFEYEAGDQHVTNAFLAIKQVGTDGGRVTYKSGRTAELGHAEVFWAVAHALSLDPVKKRKRAVIA